MYAHALLVILWLATADGVRPAPRFDTTVAPIFRRHCVRCHGPRDQEGGLRLDTYQNVLRGGEQGPALIPGDPEASLLLLKVQRRHAPPMPPRTPLPARTIATLQHWIATGAKR